MIPQKQTPVTVMEEKTPNTTVDMSSFMMFEATGDSEADSSDNRHVPYRSSQNGNTTVSGTIVDEDDAGSSVGSSDGDDSDCYGDSGSDEDNEEEDEYEVDDDDDVIMMTIEEEDNCGDSGKDRQVNHRRLMSPAPARVPARVLESDKLFWEACLAS